jgi:hypothetical protein
MSNSNKKPELLAFAVQETDGKSYYTRIGAAWPTANGGYSIRLNALPVDGKLVLFPPKENDETQPDDQD